MDASDHLVLVAYDEAGDYNYSECDGVLEAARNPPEGVADCRPLGADKDFADQPNLLLDN